MGKIGKFAIAYLFSENVRRNVGSLLSVVFAALYIIINVISGVIYENPLFVSVAAYYTVILFLHYSVIEADSANDNIEAYKASRNAGILVLIIAVPMMGIIAYTTVVQSKTAYSGVILFAFGAYTLFSVARAVVRAARARRLHLVKDRAINRITLTATLISVFNLQSVILYSLDLSVRLRLAVSLFSGAFLTASVLSLATALVRECESELKKHNLNE